MNETKRTYPDEVANIQMYMSNKTQNSNYFSLLRKWGSYKNMLYFMAIVYDVTIKCMPNLMSHSENKVKDAGVTVYLAPSPPPPAIDSLPPGEDIPG